MRYKFGLCGPFDFEEKSTGGQSVKTREFYYGMCSAIGKDNIQILESTLYKKNPFSFFFKMVKLMKNSECVVIFPAQNGIKVLAPLCKILKKCFHTKIYYSVIGGWLANIIDKNPVLKKSLTSFDCILVETNVMKQELVERKITNVIKLANFKRVDAINKSDIREVTFPVRLCYFSRVTPMKGVADAVQVVNRINRDRAKCILDIYGPITDGYENEFKKLCDEFCEGISYKGKINPLESVEIISKYDLQLFPTHYKTEGIPGSILDSYFAGVPVLAAKWNSFSDLIIDNETGVGYEINNVEDFYKKLNELIDNTKKIEKMKYRALQEAELYMPEIVIQEFLKITRR